MSRQLARLFSAAVAIVLLAVTVTACGGGAKQTAATGASTTTASETATTLASAKAPSGEVVAYVGSTPITKPEVNHWMHTVAGGDYYELSHEHTVPPELVSDPPRYGRCVTQLEATAAAAPVKVATLTGVELLNKCRQLYRALRAQAMGLIVQVNWLFEIAKRLGVSVSEPELLAAFRKSTAERYPKPGEVSRSRQARKVSASDELFLFKRNLLVTKLLAKVKAEGVAGTASFQSAQKAAIASIDCKDGYVVEYCKQFKGEPAPSAESLPASVLIEKVAALATGVCINKPACAKQ